ncbi:MAG: histidine--tRNA ligase, partial [Candidatus Jordarchaeaceae archaeon]
MKTQLSKNKKQKLPTRPYKGARDFYPEDMRIRNYIFNIWRKTALKFGFEEYDFPLIEPFEIYAAKTSEEIVNKQLYSFEDRGGRKVAIRPEKTPSVARMVAGRINELPRPIKWFNIGSCWRYEAPQKGRGREFFQFDCDILGSESIIADVEVFIIPIEVMKSFGANKNMFEIRVNNRRFAEYYLKEVCRINGSISERDTPLYKVAKAIDARPKISAEKFDSLLDEAQLNRDQKQKVNGYLCSDLDLVKRYKVETKGAQELIEFFTLIEQIGYSEFFKFSPEIMRGLDYYTGNVIEQFDLNPKNRRAMFGGGRYDNLVQQFSDKLVPGVGFAMGDMTLFEFLKQWELIPTLPTETKVYVTIFSKELQNEAFDLTKQLRDAGINTSQSLETEKLDKQLKYADRKGIPYVAIIGPEEKKKGVVKLKDMKKTVKIILDSNALFVPLQFKIDIFEELKTLLKRNFEPILLMPVLRELEKLADKGSPKMRRNASYALRLAEKCKIVHVDEASVFSPDDVIVKTAMEWSCPVFTNDRRLRKRLRDINVPVIYVRQ